MRRLSPPAKVGLLPPLLLFPRVVESMKGLSRRGFSMSGAGVSCGIGSVGRAAAEAVGEGGEATVVVFESQLRGEESLATNSSGVSAEMAMSSED